MRKIILDLAVTLDGFIEGPNGEIDDLPIKPGLMLWCIWYIDACKRHAKNKIRESLNPESQRIITLRHFLDAKVINIHFIDK